MISFLQSDRSGWLAEDCQVFFDERAAIAEFDGGFPAREAEEGAFRACVVGGSTATRSVRRRTAAARAAAESEGDDVRCPLARTPQAMPGCIGLLAAVA